MKEFSKEVIEIDGKEYTLFLNRKGIIAWDKFAREENRKIQELEISMLTNKNAPITNETNPFDNINENMAEENDNIVSKSYRKLYWIMLYENHKLNIDEVNELYDKAIEEYGEEQLIALGNQILEEANLDKFENSQKEEKTTKKLPALKPNKK